MVKEKMASWIPARVKKYPGLYALSALIAFIVFLYALRDLFGAPYLADRIDWFLGIEAPIE